MKNKTWHWVDQNQTLDLLKNFKIESLKDDLANPYGKKLKFKDCQGHQRKSKQHNEVR